MSDQGRGAAADDAQWLKESVHAWQQPAAGAYALEQFRAIARDIHQVEPRLWLSLGVASLPGSDEVDLEVHASGPGISKQFMNIRFALNNPASLNRATAGQDQSEFPWAEFHVSWRGPTQLLDVDLIHSSWSIEEADVGPDADLAKLQSLIDIAMSLYQEHRNEVVATLSRL